MKGLVWRFAGFEYSPVKGLWKDGARIPVGPQARQLLELLLQSQGAVVSKAEIGEKLWPGRRVSDDSIDRCAYLLRKPLRDIGSGDLIATAYGRGLSLRAVVETVDPQEDHAAPGSRDLDLRILDIWQAAYELAGSLTRDGFAHAQAAVLAIGDETGPSPAVCSLSANIAASRVAHGYLRPRDGAQIIERDAGRALEQAPDFLPALSVLGWSRAMLDARPNEGIEMLDRAIAQDPFYSKARAHRSWVLVGLARFEEAIDEIEAGLRVAPYDRAHLTMRAWLAFCAGDMDGTARMADDGIRLRPDASVLQTVRALAASVSGRHDEAEASARRCLARAPENPIFRSVLAYVLASAGRPDEAEATLDRDGAADGHQPYIFRAAAHLALGQEETARLALRRGLTEGCPWLAFAPFDPRLEPLRDEIDRMRRDVGVEG